MSTGAWTLVASGNTLVLHFLWWFRGLDGRCRRHVRCIIRRYAR